MIDAGVDSPLGEVLPLVRSVVGGVDVGELEASKTGTPVGPVIASSEMAGLFEDLPALAAAFRDGRLSEVQAREVAEVAMEVPDAEEQLVEAAGKLSLKELREEYQRVEAAALIDEDDRHRRVHKQRRTRAWVRKGAGHFSAVMTPDELARLMAVLDAATDDIVADAIRGGWFGNRDAHSVDALIDLIRPDSSVAAGPETMVHMLVEYDALVRGHTVRGEKCEIPGIGPIPVMAIPTEADPGRGNGSRRRTAASTSPHCDGSFRRQTLLIGGAVRPGCPGNGGRSG